MAPPPPDGPDDVSPALGVPDDRPRLPAAPAPPGAPPPGPPRLDDRLPPPPYGGPEAAHQRRWWYAVPIAIAVYFALVLATIVQPVSVFGLTLAVPIPGVSTNTLFGLPDRPFTVLVVGLDIRPSQEGQPSRTDSILLLRVDAGRERAAILSVPRDTLMQVPLGEGSLTQDRVNTAFVYNWSPDDERAAPDALAATVEANLGLTVDYYIVFDQRDAADIVDSAGGVDVTVAQAFGQDNYSDDDVNVVPQFFPEGKQHLSGYEAVAYGRIREGTSDLDRIRRQQQVAEGLVSRLSSPFALWRLPGVWGAYGGVETDLGTRQSAGLFALLKRIGTDRIVTRSLGEATVSCATCTASLLQLLPDEAARVIAEAFDDESAGSLAAQLLVANGVAP